MGANEKWWKREGTQIYPSILEYSLSDAGKNRAKLKHQLYSPLGACACRNWE